jgi:GxxExxY protein
MLSSLIEIDVCDEYESLFAKIELVCKKVYWELGRGYPESIYQNAVCIDLSDRVIPYRAEVTMDVTYKKRKVGNIRADIVCYGDYPLVIETKTVWGLKLKDELQLGRYMKGLDIPYGVLVNFPLVGVEPELEFFLLVESTGLVRYDRKNKNGRVI